MANIITSSRILFSIALLFFPTFSPAFYALYLAAGITDMIDGTVALIRIINIVSGFIMQKRFIMLHTIMNKVTGLLLFVLPLTVHFVDLKYTVIPVCAVATFAAIQEGHFIRTNRFKMDVYCSSE